jgi:hypothetical protein
MRIDATHRPWIFAVLMALGLLTMSFVAYASLSPNGPHGGSLPGLAYGIGGYGLMLYAAALGLRKKVPVWRIGRAQTWMRGHIWLGSLSFFLILFHCGFAWKGSLAAVLMVLLFITAGSGIVGAAVQHYVPGFMTRAVPLETIYEEIPHVRRQLCDQADALAAIITATGDDSEGGQTEIDPEIRTRFADVYSNTIRPRLAESPRMGMAEAVFESLVPVFDSLRRMLPATVHPVLVDIENICDEEKQLQRQRRIYLWLHGWLLVHVPMSIALLVLGAIHAVMALRF